MHQTELKIRIAKKSDLNEMQSMFVDTISTICKKDYSTEQINVWKSAIENKQRWLDKISSQYFLVAEINNKIVGYASLEGINNIDLLYTHKDHQRQGIAGILITELEREALKRKASLLSSDVSETAKPFFEKKGFQTIEPQLNIIGSVEIKNYKMTKKL